MARPNYGADKRRREIAKKKKAEEKRLRAAERAASGLPPEEDTSYLEYLNPGGPMDNRYVDDESGEAENQDR
jgi:hypothetical protein